MEIEKMKERKSEIEKEIGKLLLDFVKEFEIDDVEIYTQPFYDWHQGARGVIAFNVGIKAYF